MESERCEIDEEACIPEDFTGCILLMRCACWNNLKTKEVPLSQLPAFEDDAAAEEEWLQAWDPYVNSETWALSIKLATLKEVVEIKK